MPGKARWARWGWLFITLALGAAVIASAWDSWRSTQTAADDLVRAQAQIFLHATVVAINAAAPPERRTTLDKVVQAHAFGGLRYAALARFDGSLLVSGGHSETQSLGALDSERVRMVRVGDGRVRASFPPPWLRGQAAPSLSVLDRLAAEGGNLPIVVVEFEPIVAETLTARARQTLLLAVVVALALVAAGLGFWRISQRVERDERGLLEQRRLAALGQMSAVLAHEIRNPLASLKGHAQLVVEGLAHDLPQRRNATRVVAEATRLEALTSDLLEFARSGPMDVHPADPVALLRHAAAEAGTSQLEIEPRGAPPLWPLDERRCRQVLVNVLRNAVQAAPATRSPQGIVALEHDRLIYTIRDFGPGLPLGQEDRVFEPFFTTRTSGTGLGLAVARRIVELHGGRITAANADGGGAQFRIELARADGPG
ncbi:MAG TPA: ATP-binding protein [Gemmatimonadales bacterium]|nr:ATP-binding protein [Gemmatimonadales bacterium]